MPNRKDHRGSFGGHLDSVVKHFPADRGEAPTSPPENKRRSNLDEQRDIHTLLFERAWQMDGEPG